MCGWWACAECDVRFEPRATTANGNTIAGSAESWPPRYALSPEMVNAQRQINATLSTQVETLVWQLHSVKPLKWWERIFVRVRRWFR